MNKGLRNEIFTLCGIGALGCLLFGRPRGVAGFGLAAAGAALLAQRERISFSHESVVITGGSRGLGLALAKELVRQDASVTLLARDFEELERARQILQETTPGARVQIIPCDVTQEHELTQALDEALGLWGSIDMLINNAGSIVVAPFDTLKREDFEAQLELHLFAVLKAVQWMLPHFRRRRKGRIVNICSLGGKVAVPHMLPYDTSKFALAGFSQGLAAELEREGIPVTTIYPALMNTGSPIQAVFKGDHEKEYAWFAAGDNFPGLSLSADVAARKILQAVKDGKKEYLLTPASHMRVGLATMFPETMAWGMAFMNRMLPRGKNPTYKTGAESSAYFDHKMWSYFLRKRAHRAERSLNQVPKSDAKFNMGLMH